MKVKLSDAFELQMGKTPDRSDSSCWSGAHKWVSIADLSKADKYIIDTKETISDTGVAKSGIKVVPKGTVIMSFKLSIGKTAITTEDLYTNEAIMAFIDKGIYEIDTNYIYHLFASKDWNEGTNKAVLGLTLNKATLSQVEIEIPSIAEQKQVVEVLDKVDELISLRKKQLQKLDDLVKSRFVKMFGDRLSNNKGWKVSKLGKVTDFYNGKAHEQVIEENGEFVLVTSKCIATNGKEVRRTNDLLFPLIKGDICMVMSDVPNGRALAKCMYIEVDQKYSLNQRICCFRNYHQNATYFFHLLNRHEYFLSFNDGDSQTNLRKDEILDCPIIMPPMELQEAFANNVEQVEATQLTVNRGLDKLEQMKQALMQEYFG